MLWKPYRLRKNWQFQRLIKEGRKIVSRNFVMYVDALSTLNNCQFGISVPKKLFKKKEAVERNRCTRQIRNMLIFHLKNHNDSCQTDENHCHYEAVIITRAAYLENDFRTNQKDLYWLLREKVNNSIEQIKHEKENPE